MRDGGGEDGERERGSVAVRLHGETERPAV
jgi:hypothetical protein